MAIDATRWLTIATAAEYAAVSRDTLWEACLRDELQHVRLGGRRNIRLKAEWIDAWLERHKALRTVAEDTPRGTGDRGGETYGQHSHSARR
jgi:excisionase family DNA binding protein